jgi:hypothetical protein
MRAWIELYSSHREARALADPKWNSNLRKRLIKLSKHGHCDRSVQGRFTYKSSGDVLQWLIVGQDKDKAVPLALENLPDLAIAELTVMALASRGNHLHQFTVMVEGIRQDESPWALAVHLPDDRETTNPTGDRQGLGAGGHAALHCHVGPNLHLAPKVRVPMPPLGPVEILDWVISQIVPTAEFEPAKWDGVEDALKKASP